MQVSFEMKSKINQWIDGHKEQLIDDVLDLSRIRSLSVRNPESTEAPYGEECRKALNLALEKCVKYGFKTKNYENYCGTAVLPGKTAEQIGFFGHMDVVPEGTDWDSDPFQPFVKGNYIVGRGTSDNKGPALTALYAMRCLKELGVPLQHTLLMFFGCAEETDMSDAVYYQTREKAPKFSIIPDGFFSVCHGEKGILQADLTCDLSGSNLVDFEGGVATNAVPGRAFLVLSGTDEAAVRAALGNDPEFVVEKTLKGVKISTTGIAGHAAMPEGTLNAIWKLADRINRSGLATGKAKTAIAFLSRAFADSYGEGLNIAACDDISGKTTHCGGLISVKDGQLKQNINVRYAIKADQQKMIRNLEAICAENGFQVENIYNNPGVYVSPDHPAIPILNKICQEELEGEFEPYVVGGGSYCRKLPNAVGYGACQEENSPYNGGHCANEAMNIEQLYDAVRIYVLAILNLDDKI